MSSVNNKISNVLASIEDIEKAPAPVFFYTRLVGRMERESHKEDKHFMLLRPAMLATCLGLICVINTMVLLSRQQEPKLHNQYNNEAGIESFANEYNLTDDGNILQ
jgi:hypothetical protein